MRREFHAGSGIGAAIRQTLQLSKALDDRYPASDDERDVRLAND